MKVLIGYSMRSGSTLLQHLLDLHSPLRTFGDVSSLWVLPRILAGMRGLRSVCVKPLDLVYLQRSLNFYKRFDRLIWIARNPMDSYLSSLESGYAYLFWPPGRRARGIDTGLLKRWKRIHRHYFDNSCRWRLVRYEELAVSPESVLARLFHHLELPFRGLEPMGPFKRVHGGDYKIRRSSGVHSSSVNRYREKLSDAQVQLFRSFLGSEMEALGY